jgi:hypothetical protein
MPKEEMTYSGFPEGETVRRYSLHRLQRVGHSKYQSREMTWKQNFGGTSRNWYVFIRNIHARLIF